MLYIKETNKSVDEVCNEIQEAASQNKFGVLGIIDIKEKMAAKGIEFGPQCKIIEVCNPAQAKTVLEKNMEISSALPCRISVYQQADKVRVITMLPTIMLKLFNNPELEPVAKDVEETIIRIIDSACK